VGIVMLFLPEKIIIEIKGKLTSLLAMQAQASDAIDSVNDLLKSLK